MEAPCCWQGLALAEREPPRCSAALNGGPGCSSSSGLLSWLVGQSRFDWYRAYSQGLSAPLQLRISQRHVSLPLHPYSSDRSSPLRTVLQNPYCCSRYIRRQPPNTASRPRATEYCLLAGSKCRSMAQVVDNKTSASRAVLVRCQTCIKAQHRYKRYGSIPRSR
jgi:hypothetical protein